MVGSLTARSQLGRRLGKRIADRRKTIGWTQDQLAERVGVDSETVSRFERGVSVPSLLTLDKLAKALKTRTADLLSESSTQPADQALRLSAWLDGLIERDRVFAVEQVKRICEHLRRKN